ncbi:MAG: Mrp/NBP35 family ATP-binding protein [Paracoccus sp. (in: a-proteobacteria)]|uniref:Mrp/NBP35 family ATP-binding protein n=1 Tax=Paracoccus sp. TaxID=267 RepID=UPI0026DEF1CD|nr:Mrp/NBP35 family ATP-binding protein [Paracoccus sp. (in: a-proteobacteria)]MDO5620406.1 Mrp/NBP35 family ATP-binding protein [Paracoccus sp. (in: a-proteobacteria)]
MTPSKDQILTALSALKTPSGSNPVAENLIRALVVEGGNVRFVLDIGEAEPAPFRALEDQARAAVAALPGVSDVQIAMTGSAPKKSPPPDLKIGGHPKPSPVQPIPGVRHVIAVASGKGGVGKSTVSANLATALAAQGRRVGLLDADVYGPSQPRMMGVSGRPASPDGQTIIPLQNHGVTMMSLGLLVPENEALVWRGPMLMGALQQMLFQVQWGDLDVLIVDLPPGTGDVQLTLAQKTPLDGAIVVSTPQDVALLDARKAIDMFHKLKVPILGLVENMSTHICSNCGHEEHIFGHGGVAQEAAQMGVPLMGEVPLHLSVRVAGDSGTPVVLAAPDSPQAQVFQNIARGLITAGIA